MTPSSSIGARIGRSWRASTKLQVAHFKLSHSRTFILRAYPLQTHEMLFDAHQHALRVLGGVLQRGIHDNMKTAVDRVGVGKERQVNARFSAMVSHYLFDPEFCNPAAVWEEERGTLMTPQRPFDGFIEHTKRVSPTCLIHLERNRYSVPESFANRPVSVRVYPKRIVVAAEGRILCEHPRIIERSHQLPGRAA